MAAATGALNEGIVTLDQEISDPGKITIMQKFYPNDPRDPTRLCMLESNRNCE